MTTRSVLYIVLNTISTIVGFILGANIIFRLLGVNQSVPIIQWISSANAVLTSPFRGLLNDIALTANSIIDFTGVIALIVYTIFFSIIYRLIANIVELSVIETERSVHVT